MSDINNLISTAYLDGLYQGHKFKGDPYELSNNKEHIKIKNDRNN